MSRLPDGAQALWDEMQRESAPDVTELRATMHVARKSCYRCAAESVPDCAAEA